MAIKGHMISEGGQQTIVLNKLDGSTFSFTTSGKEERLCRVALELEGDECRIVEGYIEGLNRRVEMIDVVNSFGGIANAIGAEEWTFDVSVFTTNGRIIEKVPLDHMYTHKLVDSLVYYDRLNPLRKMRRWR